MNLDEIAPEALRLPPRERAMLAAALWESIGDPSELLVALDDEAAVALAESRDRELDIGALEPVSHDEIMRRVRP